MGFYIAIVLCSLFSIYEYTAYYGVLDGLTFIMLTDGFDNFIFSTIQLTLLKWSATLGVLGLFYGILGLLMRSSDDNSKKVSFDKIPLSVFYIVYVVILAL